MRRALILFLLFPCVGFATPVFTITIDPGAKGRTPFNIDRQFTELNSTPVDGRSISVDVVFTDEKRLHVESNTHHGILLILRTSYPPGTFIESGLPGTGYFMDMQGNSIVGTMTLLTGGTNDRGRLVAALYSPAAMGQTNPILAPFDYYGAHFDFTTPVFNGVNITDGLVRIVAADSVKIPLPEPSALTLTLIGLAALAIRRTALAD